jgi:hypothetical protein
MSSPLNLQFVFGIFTSLLIAGAWWYIALRLPYYWLLYALAILSTIGAVISIVITVVLQSHGPYALMAPLSLLHTAVAVLDAILYVAFAAWITSGTKSGT